MCSTLPGQQVAAKRRCYRPQTGHSLSSGSACPFMLPLPVRLNRDDSAVSADFINALWIIELVKLEIADGTQKLSFVLTSRIAFTL